MARCLLSWKMPGFKLNDFDVQVLESLPDYPIPLPSLPHPPLFALHTSGFETGKLNCRSTEAQLHLIVF